MPSSWPNTARSATDNIAAAQAERPGDGLPVQLGQEHHQLPRQVLRQVLQEFGRQRGRVAVFLEGLEVEAVHGLQLVRAGLITMQYTKTHAGALHLGTLLADVLAVLVVHRGQVGLEVGPAGRVVPVVLQVVALQPLCGECRVLVGGIEIDVRRRQAGAFHQGAHAVEQVRVPARVAQQAGAGHRRVRHPAQPLGEVVLAVAGIGMRPGVVEHELAMGVVLQIARGSGDQGVAVP